MSLTTSLQTTSLPNICPPTTNASKAALNVPADLDEYDGVNMEYRLGVILWNLTLQFGTETLPDNLVVGRVAALHILPIMMVMTTVANLLMNLGLLLNLLPVVVLLAETLHLVAVLQVMTTMMAGMASVLAARWWSCDRCGLVSYVVPFVVCIYAGIMRGRPP